jgi:uncharacterized membrane protein YfcA
LSDSTPLSPLQLTLLFVAGLCGGFIDAIAGGGGLITLPALLAAGLPPQVALGTNKLQSACGTSIALWRYAKAGFTGTPGLWLAVMMASIASMGGAYAVSVLDQEMLRQVIPWMLAAVAIYTACNRRFGIHPHKPRVPLAVLALVLGTALGFYDGFFGPGTGSFWTLALVVLAGLELRHATGYTKAANLASNLGSLAVFLTLGSVHALAAGAMIGGQMLGARLGAGLAIRKGARLIRPVFLTVVFAMTLKLLWDTWCS